MTEEVKKEPTDRVDRDRAVRERRKNLLVEAGAGTGKTSLIVNRLIEMIAPTDDGEALSLDRVVAITFTRRAAGEIRLRVRQTILAALSKALTDLRKERLRSALAVLDSAFIGTIHGFADRLLRLYPVESDLSPSYEIVEDDDEIVETTYREMFDAAQAGTLAARFAGTALAERAIEVEETLVAAIEARIRPTTEETDAYAKVGLDWFVRALLWRRDHPEEEPPARKFEDASFARAAQEYAELVRGLSPTTKGQRWMLRFGERLREVAQSRDPKLLFDLVRRIEAAVKGDDGLKSTIDFDPGRARDAWRRLQGELADALTAPILRWIACRLVRVRPIAEDMYEEAKRRRGCVDTLDLLLKLARLMRSDLRVRAAYQGLFDHVFVDEFQDTDPLAAEIILYLCERAPAARSWEEVTLGPGRLTLVGDPKQSIYRFRRADVAMYDKVQGLIAKQPDCLRISLCANFRSVGGLVNWYNGSFRSVLGTSERSFDVETGRVFYRPLAAHRAPGNEEPVHVLPISVSSADGINASDVRAAEGAAIAEYVRWLVEKSPIEIDDPHAGVRRRLHYRDVAVLALTTTRLPFLFTALDAASVPYTAAGGTLFLRDPLHRQFILGLRALADPDDGVAEAALLRPPFFAIDLWDVLQARAPADAAPEPASAERGRAARDLVQRLRRERFNQSPGATARRLVDETAFGRLVALGKNGKQRIRHIRELCMELDQRAADEALDFDAMTAVARSWIASPVPLDPPRPVWDDAVQVMSVHQAKGLEFPVVVLWDACAEWRAADRAPVFVVDPTRKKWAMRMHGMHWREPANNDLLDRAQTHADSERRRLAYVAATRARELLVITTAPGTKFDNVEKYVHAALTAAASANARVVEPYTPQKPPPWVVPPRVTTEPVTARRLEEETRNAFETAASRAMAPRARPLGVSAHAKATRLRIPGHDEAPGKAAKSLAGRYGPLFGDTVHRAIRLAIVRKLSVADALARAARATGLQEHVHEASEDVSRALAALSRERLLDVETIRMEYPVGMLGNGMLLQGYVDFVASAGDRLTLIDFKTDRTPENASHLSHSDYVAQVETYAQILRGTIRGQLRGGLLWTETGAIEWVVMNA